MWEGDFATARERLPALRVLRSSVHFAVGADLLQELRTRWQLGAREGSEIVLQVTHVIIRGGDPANTYTIDGSDIHFREFIPARVRWRLYGVRLCYR